MMPGPQQEAVYRLAAAVKHGSRGPAVLPAAPSSVTTVRGNRLYRLFPDLSVQRHVCNRATCGHCLSDLTM